MNWFLYIGGFFIFSSIIYTIIFDKEEKIKIREIHSKNWSDNDWKNVCRFTSLCNLSIWIWICWKFI